jgi:hypothetical protein
MILLQLYPYGLALIPAIYLALSPQMLIAAGWHYVGGGPAFEKIHPATYLLCAALAASVYIDRTLAARIIARVTNDLSLMAFVAMIVTTAIYTSYASGASFAPFIDTLLMAVLVVIILSCVPQPSILFLRRFVDLFFVVNIILISVELVILHKDLFSQYVTGIIRTPDEIAVLGPQRAGVGFGRMSALFGHALNAALLFGVYSICNIVSTNVRFSIGALLRLSLGMASFVAIFPTGGRSSLVVTAIVLGCYFLYAAFFQLIRGRINTAGYFIGSIMVVVCIFIGVALAGLGFFDVMQDRFAYDFGSSLSRDYALEILENSTATNLLFGSSLEEVLQAQLSYRTIAIEISWVNFILVGGLITAIPLLLSFVLFLFKSLRQTCQPTIFFVSIYILESTFASNSVWSKTTMLTSSLIIAICFLRRDLAPDAKNYPARMRPTFRPRTLGRPVYN